MLSEKSLFNNVLGYYCYTDGMSLEDVNEVVALPRANIALLNKSGLKYGEYIKLKYYNPTTKKFEDKFPAGSHIGWILHRSGFHCLTKGTYQFFSNEIWNPEKKDKDHTAIFKTADGNVVVGIEDLYNETLLSDKDCNDIIFHVTSYPEDALVVNTEIPEAPESDFVEEEVDVIQPLSLIIDLPETDELANDLYVASKSKLEVVDGYVTGVQDVLYIANSTTMNQMAVSTYAEDEKSRKVVVRTTIKLARSNDSEKLIEERLLTAYKRIRKNARNGLAVVQIERDACGGCFNKIPPQRKLDIALSKKLIVCEYCGRIIVSSEFENE